MLKKNPDFGSNSGNNSNRDSRLVKNKNMLQNKRTNNSLYNSSCLPSNNSNNHLSLKKRDDYGNFLDLAENPTSYKAGAELEAEKLKYEEEEEEEYEELGNESHSSVVDQMSINKESNEENKKAITRRRLVSSKDKILGKSQKLTNLVPDSKMSEQFTNMKRRRRNSENKESKENI